MAHSIRHWPAHSMSHHGWPTQYTTMVGPLSTPQASKLFTPLGYSTCTSHICPLYTPQAGQHTLYATRVGTWPTQYATGQHTLETTIVGPLSTPLASTLYTALWATLNTTKLPASSIRHWPSLTKCIRLRPAHSNHQEVVSFIYTPLARLHNMYTPQVGPL